MNQLLIDLKRGENLFDKERMILLITFKAKRASFSLIE